MNGQGIAGYLVFVGVPLLVAVDLHRDHTVERVLRRIVRLLTVPIGAGLLVGAAIGALRSREPVPHEGLLALWTLHYVLLTATCMLLALGLDHHLNGDPARTRRIAAVLVVWFGLNLVPYAVNLVTGWLFVVDATGGEQDVASPLVWGLVPAAAALPAVVLLIADRHLLTAAHRAPYAMVVVLCVLGASDRVWPGASWTWPCLALAVLVMRMFVARQDALRDPLTGELNRRGGMQHLAEAVNRRTRQRLAVLVVDVDEMKTINDTLGHTAGDRALRDAATVVRATLRPRDTLARIGGDEFLVLAWLDADEGDRVPLVEQELARFRARERRPYVLSLSVGEVVAQPHERSHHLLEESDRRMYERKRGRGPLDVVPER